MEVRRTLLATVLLLAATAVVLLLASRPWQTRDAPLEADAEAPGAIAPDVLEAGRPDEPGPALRTTAPADRPAAQEAPRRTSNRVRVRVTGHGKPVPNRGIRLYGTALHPVRALFLDARTGADGTCLLDLPEGSYTIGLIPPPRKPRPGWPGMPERPRPTPSDDKMRVDYGRGLELETDRGKAEVLLEIPGCSLEVRVLDAETNRPVADVSVSLRGEGGYGRSHASRGKTGEAGTALLREFESGTWTVNASASWMIFDPKRAPPTVTLTRGQAGAVDVFLRRVGMLSLWLTDDSGVRLRFMPGLAATLRRAQGEPGPPMRVRLDQSGLRSLERRRVGMRRMREVMRRLQRPEPEPMVDLPPPPSLQLLPGTYRLSIEDERLEVGRAPALRLQPVQAVPEHEITVIAEQNTELEIPVHFRRHVVITLRRPNGSGPPPGTRLRVEGRDPRSSADAAIRFLGVAPDVPSWRANAEFTGYLEPGTYEVEIRPAKGKGEPRTERLIVTADADPLRITYDLPR